MPEGRSRRVRIEPYVPEEWAARVLGAGLSASEFAEYVLASCDLDELIAGYRASHAQSEDADPPAAVRTPLPDAPERVHGWTRSQFERYMDEIVKGPEFRHPAALLAAYARLGPSPTSTDLKKMCGFPGEGSNFGPSCFASNHPPGCTCGWGAIEQVWHQELRAMKARLTIHARRRGLGQLFLSATTTNAGRLQPMDPTIFQWLATWVDRHPNALTAPEQWGAEVLRGAKYANLIRAKT